jgi:hypothetical protein
MIIVRYTFIEQAIVHWSSLHHLNLPQVDWPLLNFRSNSAAMFCEN